MINNTNFYNNEHIVSFDPNKDRNTKNNNETSISSIKILNLNGSIKVIIA